MITRIRPYLDFEKITGIVADTAKQAIDPPHEQTPNEFESAFASWLGVSHVFAVDRGRAALLLALKMLNIERGDEIIVQSYIFHAVIDAIVELGAVPVLADSRLDDFNVDPLSIGKKMTQRTKAIIITHLGIPCDIDEIGMIARRHNCYLIENCAHTLGSEYKGKKTGRLGDIAFFSFDVDKPLTTGDGGMIVINNDSLLENACNVVSRYRKVPFMKEKEIVCGLLLQHFVTSEDIYPKKGFIEVNFGKEAVKNDPFLLSLVEDAAHGRTAAEFREKILPYIRRKGLLTENKSWLNNIAERAMRRVKSVTGRLEIQKIEARCLMMNSVRNAVGAQCMKDYDECLSARNVNTKYYIDHLDKGAFLQPTIGDEKKASFIRYAVLNNTRHDNSRIITEARKRGLEIGIFNWGSPIHLSHPYNRLLDFDRRELPNSEYLCKRLLSLPIHPYVNGEGLERIVGFLNGLAA